MDLSRVPDDVLERAVAQINAGKPTEATFEQQVAIKAELVRRRSAADNVNANLEAAAAPMAKDPEVDSKPLNYNRWLVGLAPDEMIGTADNPEAKMYQGLVDRGFGREQAMKILAERNPNIQRLLVGAQSPAEASNARIDAFAANDAAARGMSDAPVDVAGPDMVTVDGVTFPAHRMSDGQPFNGMYTLRALREAKDAQREAQLAEMFSKSAQEDLAKYGTRKLYEYGDDFDAANVTPIDPASLNPEERKQQEQLEARRQIEKRQYAQNKALRARASGQYEADRKKARDRFTAMAMLAGGSQNINAGNRAFFNALLELPDDERDKALRQLLPMDPVRAQVEGRQLDMAARLAGDAITGALAGQGQLANAAEMRAAQRMEALRVAAGTAKANAWKGYERQDAAEALDRAGATQREREAVMRDLFGPGAAPPPAAPQPLIPDDAGAMPAVSM